MWWRLSLLANGNEAIYTNLHYLSSSNDIFFSSVVDYGVTELSKGEKTDILQKKVIVSLACHRLIYTNFAVIEGWRKNSKPFSHYITTNSQIPIHISLLLSKHALFITIKSETRDNRSWVPYSALWPADFMSCVHTSIGWYWVSSESKCKAESIGTSEVLYCYSYISLLSRTLS